LYDYLVKSEKQGRLETYSAKYNTTLFYVAGTNKGNRPIAPPPRTPIVCTTVNNSYLACKLL